jgi:hypothetical protein
MTMVFCRGCAKEIHESASACPSCGATQGVTPEADKSRNTAILILSACGWTFIMWLGFLVLGGFVIGVMNPDNAAIVGQEFGESVSGPLLLVTAIASGVLTKIGKLPGTRKSK